MADFDLFGNQPENTNDNTDGNQPNDDNTPDNQPNDTDNLFDQLVGEGKKFKSPEDLAKSKIHSDGYIEQLTSALDELRKELEVSDNADRLLNELRSRNKNPDTDGRDPEDNTRDTPQKDNTSQTVSEDTLKRLVEETLTERESKSTAERNRQQASEEVRRQLGDKAQEYVTNKAEELGMAKDRLQALAEESPSAFMTLLGLDRQSEDRSRPSNQVRSEGVDQANQPEERTNQWYINLRRTNRSKYYSPQVQAQMYKDRERLGDKFWS